MKRLFTGQAAFALLLSLLINGLVVSGASASARRVQSGNSNVYISLPSFCAATITGVSPV